MSCINWPRALGSATVLLTLATTARGQELRGTIRDSASRQPIPAAVLLLLDSSGTTLGRNITNERGVYRIALSPEMRRVRVVRIGFRPREARIPEVANGVATLDLAMQSLPTMLEAVHVIDSTTCPARPDRGAALALWEQARTGLLAAIVARTSQQATMTRLMFDRLFYRNTDDIAYQRVRLDSSSTAATSFSAAHTAAEFVASGFMDTRDDGQMFYAPDADILVDDAFARGYCFRLVSPPRSRPRTQLGLGFSAAELRRDRIEIDGTLWIDTAQRAIRDIEFRYVGLDRELDRLRPGGHVSFREAANGIVFVDRWGLRLIGSAPMALPSTRTIERAAVGVSGNQRVFVQEVGGEVARASWSDGTVWAASLGTFKGTVMQEKDPVAAGVRVHLRETDYITHTDSAGRFEIPRLLPGPYEVDLAEPVFAKFDLVQDSSTTIVAARDSVVGGRIAMTTIDDYIHDACPRRGGVVRRHILIVRALDSAMRPVRQLRIGLSSAPAPSGAWTSIPSGLTGGNGQLIVCETWEQKPLPLEGLISVRSGDDKFDSNVVDIDVDQDMRLLTALLHVTSKP